MVGNDNKTNSREVWMHCFPIHPPPLTVRPQMDVFAGSPVFLFIMIPCSPSKDLNNSFSVWRIYAYIFLWFKTNAYIFLTSRIHCAFSNWSKNPVPFRTDRVFQLQEFIINFRTARFHSVSLVWDLYFLYSNRNQRFKMCSLQGNTEETATSLENE